MAKAITNFITTEIRKAFGRLKATLLLIVKFAFIAVVNVVLWFAPLFLMSYFFLKPVAGGFRNPLPDNRVSSSSTSYVRVTDDQAKPQHTSDLRSYFATAGQFLREVRFLKRS